MTQESDVRRSVHITLQGKGGVGKTLVASQIAQYLIEAKRAVVSFDVDPSNHSLTDIKGLSANTIELFDADTGEVDVNAMDVLMQGAMTEPADVVIDAGASAFQPLADYLIRMDAPAIMHENGRDLFIHTVIVGGASFEHTLTGADELLRQMPQPAKFVVWMNEHFGEIGQGGARFEETTLYDLHKPRIAGVVYLRNRSRFFADDIAKMLTSKQTYAEAINGAAIMPKQRLIQVRRHVWEQLAHVL